MSNILAALLGCGESALPPGLSKIATVSTTNRKFRSAVRDGNMVYLAGGDGSTSYAGWVDVTAPAAPVYYEASISHKYPLRMAYSGGYIFNACDTSVLRCYDVTTPGALVIKDAVSVASISDVVVVGNNAYVVADRTSGTRFAIYDISDPSNITSVGTSSHSYLNSSRSVAVNGNYAYVASYGTSNAGVFAVDISTPSSPSVESNYVWSSDLAKASRIAVSGNYAYVVTEEDKLVTIDISTPTNISQVDVLSSSSINRARDLKIIGNYIFVTGELADGCAVFDISTPNNPSLLDSVSDADMNGAWGIGAGVDGGVYVTSISGKNLTILQHTE